MCMCMYAHTVIDVYIYIAIGDSDAFKKLLSLYTSGPTINEQ